MKQKRKLTRKNLTPRELQQLKREHRKWTKLMKPWHDAIEASRRITAEDLAIVINAKPK